MLLASELADNEDSHVLRADQGSGRMLNCSVSKGKVDIFFIVGGRGQVQKELMSTVCEDSQWMESRAEYRTPTAASLHAWQSGQQPRHVVASRPVGDDVLGGATIAALDVDSRHVPNQTAR